MLHRIFRSLLVVFACLWIGIPVWAEQLDIMVEDGAAPWSKPDGTGYANDIVAAAYAAVGVDVKFTVLPYKRCKAKIVAGVAPVCFSVSPEPGLPDAIVLSDKPLFTLHCKFYYNVTRPKKANSEDDLQPGTVVGLVNGYEYPESIDRLKWRGIIIDLANSERLSLKKLSAGRIDFAIMNVDRIKTEADILRDAGVDNLAYAFDGGTLGAYVGFSKAHPRGEYARLKFNEGYAIITRNGVVRKIQRRWEHPDVPRKN
ncbi:hypothetical protein E4K72_19140 [Oxalobacteraceae bacterium OM1]|nr:hypothetical protein E4K72_19140 [Oxalobacteraceae bacterium OM1]